MSAILKSVLPYAGQKCIGSRLLVVHADIREDFIGKVRTRLEGHTRDWNVEQAFSGENPFEFTPLINARAGERFQWALRQTVAQGGELVRGERLGSDFYPEGQYYRPALGIFPAPVPLEEEIFGPYVAVIPYVGRVEDAFRRARKPNAKLVNAFYGSDPLEIKFSSGKTKRVYADQYSPGYGVTAALRPRFRWKRLVRSGREFRTRSGVNLCETGRRDQALRYLPTPRLVKPAQEMRLVRLRSTRAPGKPFTSARVGPSPGSGDSCLALARAAAELG